MRPRDEVCRDLVRQWLSKAEGDLSAARILLSHEESHFFTVGFHAQQAAEKFLKAFLTWHQIEFQKTHDLDRLLDFVAVVREDIARSLQDISILSDYGVEAR